MTQLYQRGLHVLDDDDDEEDEEEDGVSKRRTRKRANDVSAVSDVPRDRQNDHDSAIGTPLCVVIAIKH